MRSYIWSVFSCIFHVPVYSVSIRIQSEYSKMQARNIPLFGHFSRSGQVSESRIMSMLWMEIYAFKKAALIKL